RTGSVGVVAAEDPHVARPELLAEITRDARLQHGEALVPLIDECLDRAGIDVADLNAVSVAVGPGSFTGLRVGLATAKGLVLGTPSALVGVATLEALAATLVGARLPARDGRPLERALVCACLDARRGELYAALFEVDLRASWPGAPGAVARVTEDAAASPAALVEAVAGAVSGRPPSETRPLVVVGDGAERAGEALAARWDAALLVLPVDRHPIRGGTVAALGVRDIAARGADDPAALVPRYARASDAERARRAARDRTADDAAGVRR